MLFLFVLLAGATADIFTTFFTGLTSYIVNLPALSNWIGREDTGYFHGWTTWLASCWCWCSS
ncbi:BCCT family transporter [Litchfieldella qijiaojingensis]|uniref:BCCT family transporter n=1 Tax=Litchfieldella qijiaojingensis TaxID=980347 RepID=UPI0027E46CB1|nr:BCCT family transporter [Halomonas qijiaojingensis]